MISMHGSKKNSPGAIVEEFIHESHQVYSGSLENYTFR